jgi:hypothetical protein
MSRITSARLSSFKAFVCRSISCIRSPDTIFGLPLNDFGFVDCCLSKNKILSGRKKNGWTFTKFPFPTSAWPFAKTDKGY